MVEHHTLTLEEVVDHCRALAYAIIEIPHPVVKELLIYILSERLELLNHTIDMEILQE